MEPERITFPADYPVKVVARAGTGLRPRIDEVFARQFGELPDGSVTERQSARSNFVSLTYLVRVEHEGQLSALHAELRTVAEVLMVL